MALNVKTKTITLNTLFVSHFCKKNCSCTVLHQQPSLRLLNFVKMGHQLKTGLKIGTHDGSFHCDEVLACVFLKLLYPDAEVVRSRDPEILSQCDIVVDVGGVFDHEAKRYDHHQASFDLTMKQLSEGKINSDVLVSSAGLIYWYYRRQIFQSLLPTDPEGRTYSDRQMQTAFEYLYNSLVREIDFVDNGGGQTTWIIQTSISARVSRLRPLWDDPNQDTDEAFLKALVMVKNELMGYIPRLHSHLAGREALKIVILERFKHHLSGSVIWFKNGKSCDWTVNLYFSSREVGVDCRSIFYVVNEFDDLTNKVTLTCTKSCPPNKKFPVDWRGLLDDDLERASGIKGLLFVHKNGLFASGKNKDAILKVIDRILN